MQVWKFFKFHTVQCVTVSISRSLTVPTRQPWYLVRQNQDKFHLNKGVWHFTWHWTTKSMQLQKGKVRFKSSGIFCYIAGKRLPNFEGSCSPHLQSTSILRNIATYQLTQRYMPKTWIFSNFATHVTPCAKRFTFELEMTEWPVNTAQHVVPFLSQQLKNTKFYITFLGVEATLGSFWTPHYGEERPVVQLSATRCYSIATFSESV